eukprot:364442-Chlamydomonas_euryale.AAC.7
MARGTRTAGCVRCRRDGRVGFIEFAAMMRAQPGVDGFDSQACGLAAEAPLCALPVWLRPISMWPSVNIQLLPLADSLASAGMAAC